MRQAICAIVCKALHDHIVLILSHRSDASGFTAVSGFYLLREADDPNESGIRTRRFLWSSPLPYRCVGTRLKMLSAHTLCAGTSAMMNFLLHENKRRV